MEPYADFVFYKNEYHGAMGQADYDRLSHEAAAHVDTLTFGRAAAATEQHAFAVKNACCAVADVLLSRESGAEVASETLGKWSRTFATTPRTTAQRIYEAAARYLAMTGMMCRSVNA